MLRLYIDADLVNYHRTLPEGGEMKPTRVVTPITQLLLVDNLCATDFAARDAIGKQRDKFDERPWCYHKRGEGFFGYNCCRNSIYREKNLHIDQTLLTGFDIKCAHPSGL